MRPSEPEGRGAPTAPSAVQAEMREVEGEAVEIAIDDLDDRDEATAGGLSGAPPTPSRAEEDVPPFDSDVQLTPVRESAPSAGPEHVTSGEGQEPTGAPPRNSDLSPSPLRTALATLSKCFALAGAKALLLRARVRRGARRVPRIIAARLRSRPRESPGRGIAGSGRLVAGLLASNTCLLSALLAALCLGPGDKAAPTAAAPRTREAAVPASTHGARSSPSVPTLAIPELVVRLRDLPGDPPARRLRGRFVRIALELELPSEAAKQAMSERMPFVRDAFRAYLSGRTAAELRGGQGIAGAKMGLLERVLESAPGVPVRALYVSQFLLQ